MRPKRSKQEQILIWCGVVAQLNRTRANRILRDEPLPYPLFVLLRHFCHDPAREWTVGQLTRAFETGQPGMSKKVQKLLELGLVAAREDEADARRRWLRVTRRGVRTRDAMMGLLEPDQRAIFEDWPADDVAELHRLLDRLRQQLDAQRDELVLPRRKKRG
jgi:DNA-binding MarR family transcriptional regulator